MAQIKKVIKNTPKILKAIIACSLFIFMYIEGYIPEWIINSLIVTLILNIGVVVFKKLFGFSINCKEEFVKNVFSLLATFFICMISVYVPGAKVANEWVYFSIYAIVFFSDVITKGIKNSLLDLIKFVINQFTFFFPGVKVANSFFGKYFRKIIDFFIGEKIKSKFYNKNVYFEELKKNLFVYLSTLTLGLGSFSVCFDFEGVVSRNLADIQLIPDHIAFIFPQMIVLITYSIILFGMFMIFKSLKSMVDPLNKTINDYFDYIDLLIRTNLTQPSLSFFWRKRAR